VLIVMVLVLVGLGVRVEQGGLCVCRVVWWMEGWELIAVHVCGVAQTHHHCRALSPLSACLPIYKGGRGGGKGGGGWWRGGGHGTERGGSS